MSNKIMVTEERGTEGVTKQPDISLNRKQIFEHHKMNINKLT